MIRPSIQPVHPFEHTMRAHAPRTSVTWIGRPGARLATTGPLGSGAAHERSPWGGTEWVGTHWLAGAGCGCGAGVGVKLGAGIGCDATAGVALADCPAGVAVAYEGVAAGVDERTGDGE